MSELYHEDKGFNHNRTVFLSERPPSHDVEHALATHEASKKLVYLQGSPFRPEVCMLAATVLQLQCRFCAAKLSVLMKHVLRLCCSATSATSATCKLAAYPVLRSS